MDLIISFVISLLMFALPSTAMYDNIFILSGQSNMVGMGGVITVSNPWDGAVPEQCAPDSTRIFRLSPDPSWEVATEPLHMNIWNQVGCGVGPGLAFANAVKSRLKGTIGLVPCAIGGTQIKQWQRGQALYEGMVERTRAAASGLDRTVIKGLLWYQGESDSNNKDDVFAYEQAMVNLFTNFREDIGLPQLPIIQVAITSGGQYQENIRQLQLGLKMDNVGCVDAKGLELNPDNIHLSTPAQAVLGGMLANEYLKKFA